jgi:hypothetical protein
MFVLVQSRTDPDDDVVVDVVVDVTWFSALDAVEMIIVIIFWS